MQSCPMRWVSNAGCKKLYIEEQGLRASLPTSIQSLAEVVPLLFQRLVVFCDLQICQ
jgi:hypothetical protein